MINRMNRIPMLDLSRLSGEDADTAAKNRVNGRAAAVLFARTARNSALRILRAFA